MKEISDRNSLNVLEVMCFARIQKKTSLKKVQSLIMNSHD